MRATLAWTAIALIGVLYTIPALIAFWRHRDDPADEPCSDFSEAERVGVCPRGEG